MRNRKIVSAVIIAVTASLTFAQEQPLSDEELLRLPTSVLILKDGEQLVTRGDYTVRDGIVLFYLDRGGHPVYASISADSVDFEVTRAAREQLRQERRRQQLFFRLIEERSRRLLEEAEGRPVAIRTQGGSISIERVEQPAEETGGLDSEFPTYSAADLALEPEAWWRDEAARLFAALDASNARIAELDRRHDELVLRINRARTEEQTAPLRDQLGEIRQQILVERGRARLVGNRLSDLSIIAEEQGKPLDWLLSAGSTVLDESRPRPGSVEAVEMPGEVEEAAYDPADLAGREDAWWAEERRRLEERVSSSENRMAALRGRYNDILAERDTEGSDARKIQLNQQLQALENSVNIERDQLESARRALDSLVGAARELGKEEALGLMKDRGETER